MKFHGQKFKRALFVEVIRDWLGLIEPITLGTFRDRWHCKQNKKSNYRNRSITVVENKHMLLAVKFLPGESLSLREICIGRHDRRIWKTKRSSKKEKESRVLKVVIDRNDHTTFELMRFLVKVAENEKFVNPICGQKHEERNWIKQGETITVKKYNKDKRDQIWKSIFHAQFWSHLHCHIVLLRHFPSLRSVTR